MAWQYVPAMHTRCCHATLTHTHTPSQHTQHLSHPQLLTHALARHMSYHSRPPTGRAHLPLLTCTLAAHPRVPTGTRPRAHAEMDGCRWARVAHAQPRTLTHTCAHARAHRDPSVMALCTPALCCSPSSEVTVLGIPDASELLPAAGIACREVFAWAAAQVLCSPFKDTQPGWGFGQQNVFQALAQTLPWPPSQHGDRILHLL